MKHGNTLPPEVVVSALEAFKTSLTMVLGNLLELSQLWGMGWSWLFPDVPSSFNNSVPKPSSIHCNGTYCNEVLSCWEWTQNHSVAKNDLIKSLQETKSSFQYSGMAWRRQDSSGKHPAWPIDWNTAEAITSFPASTALLKDCSANGAQNDPQDFWTSPSI